ncbi:hypothetical protein Tco_1215726 [Tanacetum coccineum]
MTFGDSPVTEEIMIQNPLHLWHGSTRTHMCPAMALHGVSFRSSVFNMEFQHSDSTFQTLDESNIIPQSLEKFKKVGILGSPVGSHSRATCIGSYWAAHFLKYAIIAIRVESRAARASGINLLVNIT